jgi:integrase
LRVSDVLRIRVKDLDFFRKQIAIQRSKGGKSRLVPMPESLIAELKALVAERTRVHENDLRAGLGWVHLPGKLDKKYPGQDHSLEWQFIFYSDRISTDPETGNIGRYHLLPAVIQRAMADARRKLKITAHYTPHCLRHATAQFWERELVPHSQIQLLLGHSDLKTTQRYLLSGRAGVPKGLPTPI